MLFCIYAKEDGMLEKTRKRIELVCIAVLCFLVGAWFGSFLTVSYQVHLENKARAFNEMLNKAAISEPGHTE